MTTRLGSKSGGAFAACVAAYALFATSCVRDGAATGTPLATAVAFGPGGVAVGATWTRKETMETRGTALVTAADGGAPLHGDEVHALDTNERRVEVLAVAGGRPVRVRVKYMQHAHAVIEGREKRETSTALADRTYVVERAEGKLVVRGEAGAPAPEAEAQLVALDFAQLGEADPFVEAIPRRPLKAGDEIAPMADALRAREVKAGLEVKAARVRLVEIRATASGRAGAFSYEIETRRVSDGESRTTRTTGVQVLRAADSADLEERADGETIAERPVDWDGTPALRRDVARFEYRATTSWP